MKKDAIKKIVLILALGVVAYAIYAVYQAFQNGERKLSGLLMAPFTALGAVWDAGTGMASGVASEVRGAYTGYSDSLNNLIDNNAPVTGDLVSPSLKTAGVTDTSAPTTDAQVAAYAAETPAQRAAGVGTVSTWDVIKSWF